MTKCDLITQSRTKRQTALAISEAKQRNGWSNSDAGDALGCGEGTIRNRLDGDDAKNQMTVHELLRSIQADGPHIANTILAMVDHRAHPITCDSVPDAISAAGTSARCAAELIQAAPGGFDKLEAIGLLPLVEQQIQTFIGLADHLREVIAGTAATKS
jgi:hypothetical protein